MLGRNHPREGEERRPKGKRKTSPNNSVVRHDCYCQMSLQQHTTAQQQQQQQQQPSNPSLKAETMKKHLLCCVFLALLLLLGTALGNDASGEHGDVVVLTAENFDDFVAQELTLVEFYAPWCGHCQRLEPEYKAAAALLAEEGIQLGKVDATEETELAERFEVQGYPTLKIFRKGQAAEYRGPRETDGIVSYMKKQAGPAVKTLEGTAVQDFALQDKELRFVVLGFFETGEDSARASLRATGDELREEISFGEVVGESAEAALQDLLRAAKLEPDSVRLPAILAVHTIGSIPSAPKFSVTVYEGTPKHDSEALSAWVKSVILPPVGEASPQSTRMYFEKGLPVAKLFVPVDWEMEANAKMARYYLVRFQKALKGFEDRILGALVDMNQVSAVWELSEMDVEPDSAEYYLLIDEPKTQKRYLFPDNTKTWNAEGVRGFIQKYLDGGLTPFIRSEPEPTEEEIAEDPVRKVVGTNFEKIVFNSEGKSVLLEIFAPWCGHCQALEPKYKAAAEELAEHQDKVILAKLDATANDFPQEIFEVQGVPSIFWIQGGNPDKVEKYEGERETSDLVDFVKSKAGLD